MERKKIKKTRPLTKEECAISRKLPKVQRKMFYERLMNGEDFASSVKPWIDAFLHQYEIEIDKYADALEALTICKDNRLPELSMLKQALQVSAAADAKTYERQMNLIVPIFYVSKSQEYDREFKKISYHFLDELASGPCLFNANMVDFIFFGDYFSVPSGVLLAKHADLLLNKRLGRLIHLKLSNMLGVVAQKESIAFRVPEDIATYVFEKSLTRPLQTEEISIMIVYSLMQLYMSDIIDVPQDIKPEDEDNDPIAIKAIEQALAYCNNYAYNDLPQWAKALTFIGNRAVWNKQVALISKFLLKIKLNEYEKLKAITYRFILKSFEYGFVNSEIIDFIFDGHTFSNASTVALAMASFRLKAHNLSGYIQEKLINMMNDLMAQEDIEVEPENIANYLLNLSLNKRLNKEEVSILNAYVLLQAFKY